MDGVAGSERFTRHKTKPPRTVFVNTVDCQSMLNKTLSLVSSIEESSATFQDAAIYPNWKEKHTNSLSLCL